MRIHKSLRRVIPASIAGVVLGHMFVYQFIFPNSGHRHDALQETGHGYLPILIVLAAALFFWSIAALISSSYRRGKQKEFEHELSFQKIVAVLFVVQASLFVGMEVAERLASEGFSAVTAFISSELLIYGIIFQLITAVLVALCIGAAQQLGIFLAATTCNYVIYFEKSCYDNPIFSSREQSKLSRIRPPPSMNLLLRI